LGYCFAPEKKSEILEVLINDMRIIITLKITYPVERNATLLAILSEKYYENKTKKQEYTQWRLQNIFLGSLR